MKSHGIFSYCLSVCRKSVAVSFLSVPKCPLLVGCGERQHHAIVQQQQYLPQSPVSVSAGIPATPRAGQVCGPHERPVCAKQNLLWVWEQKPQTSSSWAGSFFSSLSLFRFQVCSFGPWTAQLSVVHDRSCYTHRVCGTFLRTANGMQAERPGGVSLFHSGVLLPYQKQTAQHRWPFIPASCQVCSYTGPQIF